MPNGTMDESLDRPEADGERTHRLADALESTALPVLLTDGSGRLEHANDAGLRLFALCGADLTRLQLADLLDLDAEPGSRADLLSALETGGEWAAEIPIVRARRDPVRCAITLSPVRSVQGDNDGFVVTLRDVSHRVAAEEALRVANRRLAEEAARDSLTGLYNRGYLGEVIERQAARSRRSETGFTVLMADLDGFKAVNDAHGHGFGDQVLRDVAMVLPEGVRRGDVVARYGGDEFCVLLPDTEEGAARAVAERLRHLVQARRYGPQSTTGLTLSIGFATSPDREGKRPVSPRELVRRADQAMFEAKRLGGNRVLAFRDLP